MNAMRKICVLCLLAVICLVACGTQNDLPGQTTEQSTADLTAEHSTELTTEGQTTHEHVPDGADCRHTQYCTDCGEMLAEQGEHVYPKQPDSVQDGFAYYVCTVCGKIKIVNQSGAPVVPIG